MSNPNPKTPEFVEEPAPVTQEDWEEMRRREMPPSLEVLQTAERAWSESPQLAKWEDIDPVPPPFQYHGSRVDFDAFGFNVGGTIPELAARDVAEAGEIRRANEMQNLLAFEDADLTYGPEAVRAKSRECMRRCGIPWWQI